MSKYTTEVRWICEQKSGFNEEQLKLKSVDEIINASRTKIFNFEYPIYEESHRPVLENKILKHYYTREICSETVGLWQLWMNDKLNLIMPKYNKLYKAERDILNKELKNIDVHTVTLRTDDLLRSEDFNVNTVRDEERDSLRTDNFAERSDGTRTDNLHESSEFVRTDNLHEHENNVRTDNLTEDKEISKQGSVNENNVSNENVTKSGNTTNLRTDNLLEESDVTETDSFTNTNSHNDHDTKKFSDTPQGSITFAEAQDEYYWLTDYTETDNTGGATDTHTGTKRTIGEVANTGTQRNVGEESGAEVKKGTIENTREVNETQDENVRKTGTQTTVNDKDSTGNQTTEGEVSNTGTQRNVGEVLNTGTQDIHSDGNVNENRDSTGTVANTGTQEHITDESGYRGTQVYFELMEAYNKKVVNIDMLIVRELKDLFFKLW